jgi:hypothetical protein
MKKSKNEKSSKTREVKVNDLQPEQNPTGGKVTVNDISIMKYVEKSSPTGTSGTPTTTHIPTGVITT